MCNNIFNKKNCSIKNKRICTDEFKSAFEFAAIGMALVSPEGKWLKVNDATCNILGYSKEELLNLDFQTITHPDYLDTDLNYVKQMLSREIDYYEMEKIYIHKSGKLVWALLSVSLVLDDKEKPKYFISQMQDVTAKKHAENQAKKYMHDLELSNQQFEEFACVVSHDLKEPLRGAAHYSSFILEDFGSELNRETKMMLINQQNLLKKMTSLLDNLLYYSQVGYADIAFKKVDLNKIVKNVLNNLKKLIMKSKVKIKIDSLPINIICDHVRILEVYQNLIANAIKYNLSKSKEVKIGYDKERRFLYVEDNGIGVLNHKKEDIFKIFKRVHISKRLPKGDGIGLSIVKKIIERHRGSIWIENATSGKGSKFCFTLWELV